MNLAVLEKFMQIIDAANIWFDILLGICIWYIFQFSFLGLDASESLQYSVESDWKYELLNKIVFSSSNVQQKIVQWVSY